MINRSANNEFKRRIPLDERKIEIIAKGFANAQRLRILQLLEIEAELSLGDICERLSLDITNGCEHIRKMNSAGLLMKRRQKQAMRHKISNRGLMALEYLRSIR